MMAPVPIPPLELEPELPLLVAGLEAVLLFVAGLEAVLLFELDWELALDVTEACTDPAVAVADATVIDHQYDSI
jgi:hypothetical protein